jgi:hypothetical protein
MLRNNTNKTPYELWKGIPTNVKHFRVFGSKCYIKREYVEIEKFDSRVEKGLLVGYCWPLGMKVSEDQGRKGKM